MIAGEVKAKTTYGNLDVSDITKVYDGDTITVNIDNYPDIIGKKISIRINGYDTAEIRGKCPNEKRMAIKARDRVRYILGMANIVTLENTSRGKYFRIVADVIVDGINIKDILIRENLAVPYDGGRKIFSWCN